MALEGRHETGNIYFVQADQDKKKMNTPSAKTTRGAA